MAAVGRQRIEGAGAIGGVAVALGAGREQLDRLRLRRVAAQEDVADVVVLRGEPGQVGVGRERDGLAVRAQGGGAEHRAVGALVRAAVEAADQVRRLIGQAPQIEVRRLAVLVAEVVDDVIGVGREQHRLAVGAEAAQAGRRVGGALGGRGLGAVDELHVAGQQVAAEQARRVAVAVGEAVDEVAGVGLEHDVAAVCAHARLAGRRRRGVDRHGLAGLTVEAEEVAVGVLLVLAGEDVGRVGGEQDVAAVVGDRKRVGVALGAELRLAEVARDERDLARIHVVLIDGGLAAFEAGDQVARRRTECDEAAVRRAERRVGRAVGGGVAVTGDERDLAGRDVAAEDVAGAVGVGGGLVEHVAGARRVERVAAALRERDVARVVVAALALAERRPADDARVAGLRARTPVDASDRRRAGALQARAASAAEPDHAQLALALGVGILGPVGAEDDRGAARRPRDAVGARALLALVGVHDVGGAALAGAYRELSVAVDDGADVGDLGAVRRPRGAVLAVAAAGQPQRVGAVGGRDIHAGEVRGGLGRRERDPRAVGRERGLAGIGGAGRKRQRLRVAAADRYGEQAAAAGRIDAAVDDGLAVGREARAVRVVGAVVDALLDQGRRDAPVRTDDRDARLMLLAAVGVAELVAGERDHPAVCRPRGAGREVLPPDRG